MRSTNEEKGQQKSVVGVLGRHRHSSLQKPFVKNLKFVNRHYQMVDRIAVSLLILIIIHRSSSSIKYSEELDELRENLQALKQRLNQIESSVRTSNRFQDILTWFQQCLNRTLSVSTSLFIYTFFFYLFHRCVFHNSTSQTIKLLYIVNIISYSVISSVYQSFQHISYSHLAWFLLVILFLRLCFPK